MSFHTVEEWIHNLDTVRQTSSNEWKAICPAHDDKVASLSISAAEDGESAIVYCFAGCRYSDIERAVFGPTPTTHSIELVLTSKPDREIDESHIELARTWWQSYTGIPIAEWEEWGAQFDGGLVEFTWPGVSSVKGRPVQSKQFFWEPEHGPRPSLWPLPGTSLPPRIWLTEGETDAGVLRHLGFEAFATTKGASTIAPMGGIWRTLKDRGVEEVVVIGDLDPAGQKFESQLADQIRRSTLHSATVDLRGIVDPLLGEKDLRDVWRSGRWEDEELRRHLLAHLIPDIHPNGADFRFEATDLLAQQEEDIAWLCPYILPAGAIGMLVGDPKIGKSWLALDLCLSVASGTDFLGSISVGTHGSTVYLTKEDTPLSLKSRVGKILQAKGFGGSIEEGDGVFHIAFPTKPKHDCWISLQRGFYLTPEAVKDLIDWLKPLSPKLLVLDPILRMIWEADEFKAGDVAKSIFDPLSRISRELGCAILFVHHKSKGAGARGSYGSIAFHAFVDAAVYIETPSDGVGSWTKVFSEFKAAESSPWSFILDGLGGDYSPAVAFDGQRSTRDLLLDALDEAGGEMQVSVLREKLKITSESLRLFIDALVVDGAIKEKGSKIYRDGS